MKPKLGFVAFSDRRTHAQVSASTFFRRSYCGAEFMQDSTIPMPVFITRAGAPICSACVAEIEREVTDVAK